VISASTAPDRGEIFFPEGAVIFRQGDGGDCMFVVATGRVRLTLGAGSQVKEVATVGPGEFFGELALLHGAVRTATAEAVEDTTVLPIDRDAFKMMAQDDLDIVFHMMDVEGDRLRRTNEPLEALIRQLNRIRIAVGCLRQMYEHRAEPTTRVAVASLADSLRLSVDDVSPVLTDLVSHGAGALRNDHWIFGETTHMGKLIGRLSAYLDAAIGRADQRASRTART
jgi:CRP-like cAMP-binding protein